MDDRLDLLGNGHLDAVGPGQCDERPSALHPFGHHLHPVDDLVERPPLTKLEAHRAVAALRAGAGGHKVAHSARPPKVSTLPPSDTPKRPSSARPRVISTARVFSP